MASEANKRISRSMSGDLDSDGEYADGGAHDDPSQAGKPGRKKNPNSQAARRDQNRIAQREFRLRKQQRIRDLEARVEILSGNKDETYAQMRDIITELVNENQTLRNMVRGLSGFIGEGTGGCLPRMGWTLKEFEAFINKAETDTAFEAFAKRKRALQGGSGAASGSAAAEKRSAPEDTHARKRAKTASTNGSFDNPSDVNFTSGVGNAFGAPYNSDSPAMGLYSSMRPPSGFPSFLGGLGSDQAGSTSFMPGTQAAGNLGYPSTSSTANGRDAFPASYPSRPSSETQPANGPSPLQNMSFMHTASSSTASPAQSSPAANTTGDDGDLESDPKAQEARKLVGYHLENYRRNSAYCLPPSLRPTLVQRTVEHEGIIDGIPHPELRNRMILLRGRFNLADCIHSYLMSTTIHGDDVLAHANWEIHEDWIKKYGYLVDPVTLNLTNRWRKERGDPEIAMTEITTPDQLPGTT